jgi:hypothetical protein
MLVYTNGYNTEQVTSDGKHSFYSRYAFEYPEQQAEFHAAACVLLKSAEQQLSRRIYYSLGLQEVQIPRIYR